MAYGRNALRVASAALFFVSGIASAQQSAAPTPTKVDLAKPATSAAPAGAVPAKIPAAAFASQNMFSTARLSPDGNQFAVLAKVEGKNYVVVFDAETHKLVRRLSVGEGGELEWFRWAGNGKVLISSSRSGLLFSEEVRFTRLYVYNLVADTVTFVGNRREGLEGDDVLHVDPEGRFVLLSIQSTIYDWPSVWRYPLEPGNETAAVKVQAAKPGIWEWFADDAGAVRMGFEFTNSKLKVWYRKLPNDPLNVVVKLGEGDFDDKIWDVARIFSGSDEGYIVEKLNDHTVLRRFNYATRTSGEVVFQNPDWDITDADIGDDGKVKAAYFTDDKDRVAWLDPAMKTVQRRLEQALPEDDVWVLSRSRDDKRMLVFAGGEGDPGALYTFDVAKRNLKLFANYRPMIDFTQLTVPKAISYAARDKTLIRGYLTVPKGRAATHLPLIILPHGGPYGIRDKLEYSDEVQFLANRGYAILQPNYRGSGGYGEPFEDIGRGQIGRKMQDDIDDAMDWAVKEGIADPARVCVVGSSYGGYAALWAATRNPERYRCAASFAGVTDWKKQLTYDANFFNRKDGKQWRVRVTGEEGEFDLDTVSPVKQAARLTRPVLLAHGDKDSNVPFSQFKMMRDAAAKARVPLELAVFPKVGHGFDRAEDEQRWYATLEAFLIRHNPPD